MSKKLKTFQVMVDITLSTDVSVSAESLEEAISKVREYKTVDVVDFDGSHNDSSIKVTGAFEE